MLDRVCYLHVRTLTPAEVSECARSDGWKGLLGREGIDPTDLIDVWMPDGSVILARPQRVMDLFAELEAVCDLILGLREELRSVRAELLSVRADTRERAARLVDEALETLDPDDRSQDEAGELLVALARQIRGDSATLAVRLGPEGFRALRAMAEGGTEG